MLPRKMACHRFHPLPAAPSATLFAVALVAPAEWGIPSIQQQSRWVHRWSRHVCGSWRHESAGEQLARRLQWLVRRDVRQACEWDAELKSLGKAEKEARLLELARFEFLTSTERHIYLSNGGLDAVDDAAPPPVQRATRFVAGVAVLMLVVLPAYFLLAFGVTLGATTTNSWLAGTLSCWALGFAVYEPITIFLLNVMLPSLIRGKLKSVVDPAAVTSARVTFPFRTPLREHATT